MVPQHGNRRAATVDRVPVSNERLAKFVHELNNAEDGQGVHASNG